LPNYSHILLTAFGPAIRFNAKNLPDVCNIDDEALLNLCGGIPVANVQGFRMEITLQSSCIYEVAVYCDAFYVNRTIDFNSQEIINNYMRVRTEGHGTGTELFINQVEYAQVLQFNMIQVIATGPEDGFTGHRKWGRLGFNMSDMDMPDFQLWCTRFKFVQANLFDLLQTEGGYKFWTEMGFSWLGTFDLGAGSICLQRLDMYLEELKQKGIRQTDV